MKRTLFGFTLIEIMIVVAILGILASIAYPSYVRHVQRAHRTDAEAALMQNAQALERHYTENNTYATFNSNDLVQSDRYTIAFPTNPTATSFILTATPIAGSTQADDVCKILTLEHTGARSSSGSGQGCW